MLTHAHRNGGPRTHPRPLREPELPGVVWLLRGQRLRGPSRARVQRDPQRGGAHRRVAALQVPRHRARSAAVVDRIITRDVAKMAVGQVFYTPWCDEHGKVIDDGTVSRLGGDDVSLDGGGSEPALVPQNAAGLDVDDRGHLRGGGGARPAGADIGAAAARRRRRRHRRSVLPGDQRHIAGVPVDISRTGYTGDLGYEIWMPAKRRRRRVGRADGGGRPFDIKPAGMLALDVARVEAGLLLIDVDFFSSKKALIRRRNTHPSKWARPAGQPRQGPLHRPAGAAREQPRGHARQVVGLEMDWTEVEGSTRSWAAAVRRGDRVTRRRARVPRGRQVGKRDDHDLVAGVEEDDRARDDRSAALRGSTHAADGGHGRSGASPVGATWSRRHSSIHPEDGDAAK